MNFQVSQQIRQSQSLVMTPQLQQAICLLQLGNLDLRAFIENEAEENPFVDVRVSKGEQDYGRSLALPSQSKGGASSDDFDYIGSRAADNLPSLYGHVSSQFDLMFTDPRDRMVAEVFLEALEPNGWLGEEMELIAERAGLSIEDAEEMLHLVQRVEPAGLFARTLSECLSIQVEEKGLMTPLFRSLLDNLPMLAAADLNGLCRVCGCTMDELKPVLKELRSLNPKPGTDFIYGDVTHREPDLIVSRGAEGWQVDLNRSTLPAVVVDEDKAQKVMHDRTASTYIGERLSVARWLRRAVEHRNQTTLMVGAEIVRRQTAFLNDGPAHIVPMTLKDVADAIGVHESTVSRVTTGILIVTPQGTFGLKSFFSTALASDTENAASSAAVRHRIQKLVKDEDPMNPLSDDAIAKVISDEGTHLARRTVAKYRDMLKIPSSFQRKRAAKLAQA